MQLRLVIDRSRFDESIEKMKLRLFPFRYELHKELHKKISQRNHPDAVIDAAIAVTIKQALERSPSPADAAYVIKFTLTGRHDIQWGEGTLLWLTLLCQKWRDKTPDIEVQSEGIASRIMRQYRSPQT